MNAIKLITIIKECHKYMSVNIEVPNQKDILSSIQEANIDIYSSFTKKNFKELNDVINSFEQFKSNPFVEDLKKAVSPIIDLYINKQNKQKEVLSNNKAISLFKEKEDLLRDLKKNQRLLRRKEREQEDQNETLSYDSERLLQLIHAVNAEGYTEFDDRISLSDLLQLTSRLSSLIKKMKVRASDEAIEDIENKLELILPQVNEAKRLVSLLDNEVSSLVEIVDTNKNIDSDMTESDDVLLIQECINQKDSEINDLVSEYDKKDYSLMVVNEKHLSPLDLTLLYNVFSNNFIRVSKKTIHSNKHKYLNLEVLSNEIAIDSNLEYSKGFIFIKKSEYEFNNKVDLLELFFDKNDYLNDNISKYLNSINIYKSTFNGDQASLVASKEYFD